MTCDELEAFLHPYLDGEFAPEERLELDAHLAGCAGCARKLHEEARFREAFRQRMHEVMDAGRAPASLRARVRDGLRHEQAQRRRAALLRASAAAFVLLSVGGAYVALRPGAYRPYMEDAARRHARPLPPEIQPTTHEAVERWLDGKLEHRVAVPRFPNLAVRSARIANVKDRTAAYVTYEAEGAAGADAPARRVGLFFFADSDDQVGARPLPRVEVDSSHGYNVAIWRDGEVVYELVSDLDEDDIRKMVAAHAEPAPPSIPARPTASPPPALELRNVSVPSR